MKDVTPKVNSSSQGRAEGSGSGPKISKERECGKNLRRLLKLVCSALLNPGEKMVICY